MSKKYKEYSVGFFLKSDVTKEVKKQYGKTLYSIKDKENFQYVLVGKEKTPKAELVGLCIYDVSASQKLNNGVLLYKDEYIFCSSSDRKHFDVSFVPEKEVDDIGLDDFAESYFHGYAYRICDSISELRATHIKKEYKFLKALAILLIAGFAFFVYNGGLDSQIKKRVKAPKPTIVYPTMMEKSNEKKKLSLEFIDNVLSQSQKIALSDKNSTVNPSTTRMSFLNIENFADIPVVEPYYDEENNQWIYDDESKKRGGMSVAYSIGVERKYADIDFMKKDKTIFYKEDKKSISHYFKEGNEAKQAMPLTAGCLKKAFNLGTIEKRNGDYLHYSLGNGVKNMDTLEVLNSLRDLLVHCPAYISNVTLDGKQRVGDIYFYFAMKEKEDKNATATK